MAEQWYGGHVTPALDDIASWNFVSILRLSERLTGSKVEGTGFRNEGRNGDGNETNRKKNEGKELARAALCKPPSGAGRV